MHLDQWADHLESIAAPALMDTPIRVGAVPADPVEPARLEAFVSGFTDELGHRRLIDRPLLLRTLGLDDHSGVVAEKKPGGPDLVFWEALVSESHDALPVSPGPGPITGEAAFSSGAIETATETELGALHACGHIAAEKAAMGDRTLLGRVFDAARWHVDVLQPDNGTNHPWALHVFLWLAGSDETYSHPALLHAEGLLHNAIVRTGRPDRFSACLLLDSARALRAGTP